MLDPDCGIGFPVSTSFGGKAESYLLDHVEMQNTQNKNHDEDQDVYDSFKNKIKQSFNDSKTGVDLSKIDLKIKGNIRSSMPGSFTVMCSKLPDDKILLHSAGGSSALGLLGRFSLGDTNVQKLCSKILNSEEEFFNGSIIAEIVFVPAGKEANVIKREVLTAYHIPVNAGLLDNKSIAIPVSDIYVSIYKDEIILFSKNLGKRIIPRLSSAHNYTRSALPLYFFLCAIQSQNIFEFFPGNLTAGKNKIFSPRLSYKRVILKPASWVFEFDDYSYLLAKEGCDDSMCGFLTKGEVPRYFAIKEGDNELPLDSKSTESISVLWSCFKKKHKVEIIEWLHFSKEEGNNQYFTNQIILPVLCKRNFNVPVENRLIGNEKNRRSFLPGSCVLSLKIYCGAFSSALILEALLMKLGTVLIDKGYVKFYFFVRYQDPHYHLRIRYFLEPEFEVNFNRVFAEVMRVSQRLKEDGYLWNIELGTYNRELKRYGPSQIDLVEHIFYLDSASFLRLDAAIGFMDNEKDRLLYAFANVDFWFRLFGLSLNEKINFAEKMKSGFLAEFKNSVAIKSVNALYGRIKPDLHSIIERNTSKEFSRRNKDIRTAVDLQRRDVSDFKNILPDIIHMSQNRFFLSDQRLQEFLVYELIWKYYKSKEHTDRPI